jgi:hypothetical protein
LSKAHICGISLGRKDRKKLIFGRPNEQETKLIILCDGVGELAIKNWRLPHSHF